MLKSEARDPLGYASLYYDTSKHGDEGFFPDYGHIVLWRSTVLAELSTINSINLTLSDWIEIE